MFNALFFCNFQGINDISRRFFFFFYCDPVFCMFQPIYLKNKKKTHIDSLKQTVMFITWFLPSFQEATDFPLISVQPIYQD